MPIEGVTFDWWHTVAEPPWPDYTERMRHVRVRGIQDGLRAAGVVVDDATLYRAYDALDVVLHETWARIEDLAAETQVESFLRAAGLQGRTDLEPAVVRAFRDSMFDHMPVLRPHIADTLARLRYDGYRIGMVSNTGRTWGRLLRETQEKLGIAGYFDVRAFSDEVCVRKPGRAIFTRALDGLRLAPANVVHIGDDADADIAGASDSGMRAIWYNNGSSGAPDAGMADAVIRDFEEVPALLQSWRKG